MTEVPATDHRTDHATGQPGSRFCHSGAPPSKHPWTPEMFEPYERPQPHWSTPPISFSDPTRQRPKVLRCSHGPIARSPTTSCSRHIMIAADSRSRDGFSRQHDARPDFSETGRTPCPTSSRGARSPGRTSARGAPRGERWPGRYTGPLVTSTCLRSVSRHPICSYH